MVVRDEIYRQLFKKNTKNVMHIHIYVCLAVLSILAIFFVNLSVLKLICGITRIHSEVMFPR